MNHDDPAVAAARDLTEEFHRVNDALENEQRARAEKDTQLAAYGRRNRQLIWITIGSLVFDVVLTVILGLLAIQVHDTQTAATRQGMAVETKLCASFNALAALQPPAGNPATNPSRAYEQSLHVRLDQVGISVGCKLP
jgi:hypothetical protein